jgi:hypothetical protein
MQSRRSLVASLFLVCALASNPCSASACISARGNRVVLASQAMDPDVFVWDSMTRLTDYTAGKYKADDVLKHTLLVAAGTEAVVVACHDHVAHPRFSSSDADAVGIKLSSGRYKGRYGWIVSLDLHPSARNARPHRKP